MTDSKDHQASYAMLISSLSRVPALSVPETAGGLPEALAGLPDHAPGEASGTD